MTLEFVLLDDDPGEWTGKNFESFCTPFASIKMANYQGFSKRNVLN